MSYGYSLNLAATDSLVTNSLLLAACWIVSNILRYYIPYSDRYWYVLFLSLIFSLVVNALSKFILNLILVDPLNSDYIIFLQCLLDQTRNRFPDGGMYGCHLCIMVYAGGRAGKPPAQK